MVEVISRHGFSAKRTTNRVEGDVTIFDTNRCMLSVTTGDLGVVAHFDAESAHSFFRAAREAEQAFLSQEARTADTTSDASADAAPMF